MATGTVKFFNATKGFGFIERSGEEDIFVHTSQVNGSDLQEGQQVEFEVGEGRKGAEAQNVRAI